MSISLHPRRMIAALLALLLVGSLPIPFAAAAPSPTGGHGDGSVAGSPAPWWVDWLKVFDQNRNRIDDEAEALARRKPNRLVPVLVTFVDRSFDVDAVAHSLDAANVAPFKTQPMVDLDVPASKLELLSRFPGVAAVQYDRPLYPSLAVSGPATQAHNGSGANSFYNGRTAQDLGYTGEGAVVAVLDTGVQDQHSSFAGKWIAGTDVAPQIPVGTCFNAVDDNGHGSHVASTAVGSFGTTMFGTAKAAKLVEVKIAFGGATATIGPASIGSTNRGFEFVKLYNDRLAAGDPLCGANDDHIDVATLSFGSLGRGGPNAGSTEPFIDALVSSGVAVTIAVGNCGPSPSSTCTFGDTDNGISSPGNAAGAIGVASYNDVSTVDRANDVISTFSSRGPNSGGSGDTTAGSATGAGDLKDRYRKPEIAAPGQSITAAGPVPFTNSTLSGTSMATPHVAGIAALLLEAGERAKAETGGVNLMASTGNGYASDTYQLGVYPVRDAIVHSAEYKDAGSLAKWTGPNSAGVQWNNAWGYGQVNAFGALCWAWANVLGPAGATPPAEVEANCVLVPDPDETTTTSPSPTASASPEPTPTESETGSPSPTPTETSEPSGTRGTYPAVPDDPYFGGADPADFDPQQWGPRVINAPQAWGRPQATGFGVKVAVLDTGLDVSAPSAGVHPDFDCPGKVEVAPGAVAVGSGGIDDIDGHGTHVAGIIGACTNNGVGTVGVAPDSTLLPFRVFSDDDNYNGDGNNNDRDDLADAIRNATDAGAHVISMSLSYGLGLPLSGAIGAIHDETPINFTPLPEIDAALEYARENGVVIVAAAGNDTTNQICDYPAYAEDVICVVATDPRGLRTWYSNGPVKLNDDRTPGPSVAAPGGTETIAFCNVYQENVLSTYSREHDNIACSIDDGYQTINGTSMATPHVAGVAALAWDRLGAVRTPDNAAIVSDAILRGAKDLGPTGYDAYFGHGRVDALATIELIEPVAVAQPTTVSVADSSARGGQFGDDATIAAELLDDGGAPIEGAELAFALTGENDTIQWTATTEADGVASATKRLEAAPGAYDLTVAYAGEDGAFEASDTLVGFVIEKEETATTLEVTGKGRNRVMTAMLAEDGGPLAGREIVFYADGVEIARGTTDEHGFTSEPAPNPYRGGHFLFEARYTGNENFAGSSATYQT